MTMTKSASGRTAVSTAASRPSDLRAWRQERGRGGHAIAAAEMPDRAGIGQRRGGRIASATAAVADDGRRQRIRHRGAGLCGRHPREERLQHDEPQRDHSDRGGARIAGRMRLAREPLAWHPSTTLSGNHQRAPAEAGAARSPRNAAPRRDGQPRIHRHRDHAGGAAQGLCLRHLPDGGKRRGSRALLDRARDARHHPARPLSPAGAARAHRALRPLHRHGQPRLRRGARRLRLTAAGPSANLDQRAHPHALPQAARAPALPQPRSLRRATNWSAGSMASRSAARSSARACFTARATRRRSRWCI